MSGSWTDVVAEAINGFNESLKESAVRQHYLAEYLIEHGKLSFTAPHPVVWIEGRSDRPKESHE